MSVDLETERFHVETGPENLFRRVRSVMQETELKLHADHFQQRADERDAPIGEMQPFQPGDWQLRTAEVRTDTGKFVSTGWYQDIDGQGWWIVIGLHDTVVTVFPSDKQGLGDEIVRGGMLYAFVQSVNRKLLQEK